MTTLKPILLILALATLLQACQSQPLSQPALSPHISQPASSSSLGAQPAWATASVTLSPTPASLPTSSPTPTPPAITTLLFTGVIVPARCVQAAIDTSGNHDYLYDEVRRLISEADIAVGTLNATLSEVPPHTGCVSTYVLVGDPENADAMARAGFDVMSVATNHIKDCGLTTCGDGAFFDTLEHLQRVGILAVGAGENLEAAMQPVVVEANGTRFGIVSLGQIEQGGVYAEAGKPGIAVLTEENVRLAIERARQVSDVVIVMPHWGPEDVSVPNWIQRNLAAQIVEAGADLVVGNHTHVVQAVQEIDGVTVFYGLGNFIFDQWRLRHKQGVILVLKFEGTKMLSYELIPTHVDGDGRVHLAAPDEAAEILERIEGASQAIE
ncbi:MAG: CapA family protein [Anaerolineales bacterium]|nr:CapA family protein [Anaerolineales bacterium]